MKNKKFWAIILVFVIVVLVISVVIIAMTNLDFGDRTIKDDSTSKDSTQEESLSKKEISRYQNAGTELIVDAYDIASPEELMPVGISQFGNDTAVYYVQCYQGIEIYDSAMVSVVGGQDYCGGTYYDLSQAFGDDFFQLSEEAKEIPKWMYAESETFTILPDSIKPVIYITKEDTAVICRRFLAQVETDGTIRNWEIVLGLDNQTLYDIACLDDVTFFTETELEGVTLSKENNRYYAYDNKYNFYVASEVYDSSDDVDIEDYAFANSNRWYVSDDKDLIYSSNSSNWGNGERQDVLTAMAVYRDVLEWYDDNFDYVGIDGRCGASALILCDQVGGTAMNINAVAIALTPDVTKSPDVLVHEVAHSVFHHTLSRNGGAKNETSSLNEAIADTFAAIYNQEDTWHVGKGLSSGSRNITKTQRNYSDYRYDRYIYSDETDSFVDAAFTIVDGLGLFIEKVTGDKVDLAIYKDSGSSSSQIYYNSYIISNTMYRIWNKVFEKDYDAFGDILYKSLRFLPKNPTFSDFRDAFLYTMSLYYDEEYVANASTCFDAAGVKTNKRKNIHKVKDDKLLYDLEDLSVLTCGSLSKLEWDNFEQIGYIEGTYFYEAKLGSVTFEFTLFAEGDPMMQIPYFLRVTDYALEGVTICDDIKTGESMRDLEAQLYGLTPVDPISGYDYSGSYFTNDDTEVVLWFADGETGPVLVGGYIDNLSL